MTDRERKIFDGYNEEYQSYVQQITKMNSQVTQYESDPGIFGNCLRALISPCSNTEKKQQILQQTGQVLTQAKQLVRV